MSANVLSLPSVGHIEALRLWIGMTMAYRVFNRSYGSLGRYEMGRKLTEQEEASIIFCQKMFAAGDTEAIAQWLVEVSKAKALKRAKEVRGLRVENYDVVRQRLAEDDGSRISLEGVEKEYIPGRVWSDKEISIIYGLIEDAPIYDPFHIETE